MSRPRTTPFDHILDFLETAPPDDFRKAYLRMRHVAMRRGIHLNGPTASGRTATANRKPRRPANETIPSFTET